MLWNPEEEDQVARKCHHKYNKVLQQSQEKRQPGHGHKRAMAKAAMPPPETDRLKAEPAREDP